MRLQSIMKCGSQQLENRNFPTEISDLSTPVLTAPETTLHTTGSTFGAAVCARSALGDLPLASAPGYDASLKLLAMPDARIMSDSVHHILLVEDSEDDALLIRSELRKINRRLEFKRVDCAEDMHAALAERRWDLVISDHRMPRFDSMRAYNELKRSHQDIPFIIMSGTLPEQTAALAMRTGATDFIDKANRARLVPVVERELRNASMRRAKEDIEQSLIHLTYHDQLTGLPNREMLAKLIEHSLGKARTERARAALLFLDLDRFMRINESLGYSVGDELLKRVASRLTAAFSEQAVIARMGQDKFAMYFDEVGGAKTATQFAEAVCDAFSRPFEISGDEMFVNCCVGVCLYPEGAQDSASLLRNAESAKFEAKKLGPGNMHLYAIDPVQGFGNPLRLESALRHAVERQELFLLYQPLVDTQTGIIIGTEALVRWRHPQFGLVLPDAFIPLANETGLIVDIGRWVLAAACHQNNLWHDLGMAGMTVAVNVSAAQFRKPGFADDVAEAVVNTGLDPNYLELEITESVVMHDAASTIGTLQSLKNMGVRISVDDFGTGYSSLSYLKRFPIDVLKIDQSFIRGVENDTDNQAIVRTIVALAKSLKLTVVAEGVETVAQFDFVREQRCDRAQGYLVSRPVEAAQIVALSASRHLPGSTAI